MEATETKLMMISKFTFKMKRKRVKKKIKNSLPQEIGFLAGKNCSWMKVPTLIDRFCIISHQRPFSFSNYSPPKKDQFALIFSYDFDLAETRRNH